MKKVIIGMFALTLLSTAAIADTGKGRKAKAKKECTKNCPPTKDCKPTAKCPNKPGCVCN